MKRLINIILLTTCLFNVAFAQQDVVKYTRNIGDFSSLKVVDGINVVYQQNTDSIGYATFTTTAEKAALIILSNNNNALNIQISTDGIGVANLPTLYVYSQTLINIENTGDSTVCAYNVAPIDRFQARLIGNGNMIISDIKASDVKGTILNGNGTITLSGKCKKLTLNSKSTGQILADKLIAEDVKCILFGTGDMKCHSDNKIMVIGSGSGKIYYSGNATDIINRSFGININPVED